jgi:hypothetical protein
MKRFPAQHPMRGQRGAALLAALCFMLAMAMALGTYVTLCYRTLQMSTRNMQGTRSIELAEAGMEEALLALNSSSWSGWTINGTTASKTITGFTFDRGTTGQISISITNYAGGGTRTVAVTGTTTDPVSGAQISRTLSSTSAQAPLLLNAIAATTSTVSFASAGTIDSYDSSKGDYTAAVQTPTYNYSAVVASTKESPTAASVQLVNAQVKGYAASNYSGGPSYSTSAKIVGPTTPGTTKIDTSRISSSPYQPVFEIKTPASSMSDVTLLNPTTGSTTTIGTAGATSATVYRCSSLNMTGTTKIIVDGPVKLVVSGTLYIGLSGGSPSIEITSNGTLEIFALNDIAIYGNGINNLTKDPARCVVYSTNALTAPDMNTAVAFYGVIYTPYGDFKVWSNNAIYGALVARKVVFSGSAPVFHYDLNLRTKVFSGVDTPYAVSDWHETTNGT